MNTTQDANVHHTRVVVLGAGYAGMIATNRLLGSLTDTERTHVSLTVVNPRSDFVERIRLHQLAAGSRETVTVPLHELLHPQARIMTGRAELIDPDSRIVQVTTSEGTTELAYDYVVYAVGSVAAAPIPGAREHAFLLGDHDAAQRAAQTVRNARPRPRVTVIGGGFTGVEAASEFAEQHPDAEVALLCAGELVPAMRPAARKAILGTLQRLGVTVCEYTPVTRIEEGKLHTHNGSMHAFDVCVVATSFSVPDLARVSGLAVDGTGRLRVDKALRSIDAPNVLGAGDAIVAPDDVAGHLRMSCAVALPLGAHAAETILAAMRGNQPADLSIGFLFQAISLGRKNGYVQVVRADDSPRKLHVGGRIGARVKEMICTMVVDAPKKESKKPGVYSWPKGPQPKDFPV